MIFTDPPYGVAIGDKNKMLHEKVGGNQVTDNIAGIPYPLIVRIARDYIREVGGFEKFAEWGLIRPQR